MDGTLLYLVWYLPGCYFSASIIKLLIRLKIWFENYSKSNVFWGLSEPNQFNKLINVQVRSEGDEKGNISPSKQKDEKTSLNNSDSLRLLWIQDTHLPLVEF